MTTDRSLNTLLRAAATDVPPLSADAEAALWAATERGRLRRTRRANLIRYGMVAAAALILGVGIGRGWPERLADQPIAVAATSGSGIAVTGFDRLVSRSLPIMRSAERDPAALGRADVEEMLWLTRRLRDKDLAASPDVGLLLSDLELVLVQLLDADTKADPVERTLAGQAVTARAIVPRLEQLDTSLPSLQ